MSVKAKKKFKNLLNFAAIFINIHLFQNIFTKNKKKL